MPERFEICIVYKKRYINTLPFLFLLRIRSIGSRGPIYKKSLPLYTTTESDSVAPPGEYIGNIWVLAALQRGGHSHSYCQHHVNYDQLCENVTSSTKPEIHNLLHCRKRRTESPPQVTCTENFVKFERVAF